MHGDLNVKSIITQFELSCKGVDRCPIAGYIRKIMKKKIQSCESNNERPHLTDWTPLPISMMF